MKNPQELIGKKVKGFKFGLNHVCGYSEYMNKFIGVEGIVEYYREYSKSFGIRFDEEPNTWLYPADQIEAHLVEDEIPTLSDGVMMLVSDDNERWIERQVMGKKGMFYYYWYGNVLCKISCCKPIVKEPTKEEQLIAILGSSDKVAEIMKLFKKD